MKLTITNNGTEPFSVSYSDLYKLYNEDDYQGEQVVLQPDTSITIDNVEEVLEIKPVSEEPEDSSTDPEYSLESLELDDDSDDDDAEDNDLDESDDEDDSDGTGNPDDPDDTDEGVHLTQEDFDLIEQEADKPKR